MDKSNTTVERPLSPHLQVYRLTLTMAMSVAHRATAIALYFGTVLFVWWLMSVSNARNFEFVNGLLNTWIGRLVLFGYTWALLHHLLGGVRHLVWDSGRGLGPAEREFAAWATIVGSVTLTLLIWAIGLMLRG